MKRLIILATTVFCFTVLCQGKPAETGAVPGAWTMDFDAARKVAAEKKLPIFINFTGSDWCGWCKHMEKEVFSKKEWTDYTKDSLMLVWIDFPKDKSLVPEKYRKRNKLLSETFEVKGYPTYIILDDNGKDELGQLQAEQTITPQGFIIKLNAILSEREAAINKLIATMPEKEGDELKAAYEERATARKELITLKNTMEQLSIKLKGFDTKIEDMRTAALIANLTPEQSSKYQNAKKELAAAEKAREDWIATEPERNEENGRKYKEMSEKISELESKVTTLLYSE
jgi:thioredoxin-related protein